MRIEFICENDDIRLSEELKLHVSRKLYKNIKSSKAIIYVNGIETKTYKLIKRGDSIHLDYLKDKEIEWPIYESKLDIRYEDEDYLIVYKRGGLLSIPTKSEPKSLYQEVLYYLKENKLPLTVSILNRLDKDTMGLMVIAKNRLAAYNLQPTHLKMERRYLCEVEGHLTVKEGTIKSYMKKGADGNKRIITKENDPDGKLAISHYRVLKEKEETSILEFVLETGRTHQIRLHSSSIGHPIIGDKLYNNDPKDNFLHLESYLVRFTHYRSGKEILIRIGGNFYE